MRVLSVNAGSTSLKLRLVGHDDAPELSADLRRPGDDLEEGLRSFLYGGPPPDAVAHRIVHGGHEFFAPVRIDGQIRNRLGRLTSLAPLHNPPALEAIDVLTRLQPGVPAVACFDTAFHHDLPARASTYALPASWRELGIRRFGFHGLSCTWSVKRAAAMTECEPAGRRLVICHLGGGASVTAVSGEQSRDTSMGFTPTAGLVMATRTGDVDPGLLTWMQREHGVTAADVEETLESDAGLLGLSGSSGDLRRLLEQRSAGDDLAELAVAVYEHRLIATIAAMAAAIQGIDLLVFTGGVGEHSAVIRQEITDRLGWLGVFVDPSRNRSGGGGDRDISTPSATCRTLVIEAREDLVMAAECRQVISSASR